MEGHGHQVPLVDVPGPGDDLHRRFLGHIHLADPHVVGVGVALHGQHLAHHHVGDLSAQVVGELHLGAGQGHGLGKLFIIDSDMDELVQPFA